ncbi:uncharacterized protein I303_100089 [Kwoniella dejecticola CBS 10117]|uniref:Calpain catalytic domain-containing protein n=1 Tax=Kwoniella dejecticola CBS 10117 TaxID=1296121 RepID=A0A1A6AE27_9TREE|nr:uncharacterized protein I303_00089 [Kwoniella dejecticola CBS 10117]OBR88278.1 hypothetical protein I303_00089 [Kwoniella dejecticola CBS 10117]
MSLLLAGVLLVSSSTSTLGQGIGKRENDVRVWNGRPRCSDIRASTASSWLPAAMCALAKSSERIQTKIIENLDDDDPEKDKEYPQKLRIHIFNQDLTPWSHDCAYDEIGWDDSNGLNWWTAPIHQAVIKQDGGWYINKETNDFQSDNTVTWDPALGLRILTGIESQVKVKGKDFTDSIDDEKDEGIDKAWSWLKANADRSPMIITTRPYKDDDDPGLVALNAKQCYTVMTTAHDGQGDWIELFDPFANKQEWYKWADVVQDLDQIGHLKDFASV